MYKDGVVKSGIGKYIALSLFPGEAQPTVHWFLPCLGWSS